MSKQKNGTGSFHKRPDGTVQYRASCGIDSTGKVLRKSFYGRTERECTEKYRVWMRDNSETPIEKVKTIGEWAEKWLKIYKEGSVEYGTYRNYEMYVKKHIIPQIGKLRFDQVRPAHIAVLFESEKKLSESARHHLYITLNGIFKTAIQNKLCKDSPLQKPAKTSLSDQITIKVFTPEAIQLLLESDHIYAAYVKLLLYTGLRLGELIGLKWADVDFQDNSIIVCRSIARAKDGGFTEKKPKSGKSRYIPMTPNLVQILDSIKREGFYVLSNPNGSPLTPHQFESRYKQAVAAAGVDYLSPHKCRHTYGTYLIKGGAELRAVQSLFGHSKVEVTELYTHVDTDHLKKNVIKLAY